MESWVILDLKKIKQQINAFCIRHGFCYDGTKWTQAHLKRLKKPMIKGQSSRKSSNMQLISATK